MISSDTVIGNIITGNLRVVDVDDVYLLNNNVGGNLRVIRSEGNEGVGVANVAANTVVTGNIAVLEYAEANLVDNETFRGNIRVIGNLAASVHKNISARNLRCRGNEIFTAILNYADGINTCQTE